MMFRKSIGRARRSVRLAGVAALACIAWMPALPAGTPVKFTERIAVNTIDGPETVMGADIDGDGDTDLVAASGPDGRVVWYENWDGRGMFGTSIDVAGYLDTPAGVTVADIDGDGDSDILAGSAGGSVDGRLFWYANDGKGTFGASQIVTKSAPGLASSRAGDIDGDNDLDVLVASTTDNKLAWYKNTNSKGVFGTSQIIARDVTGIRLGVLGLLDDDDRPDALGAAFGAGAVRWHRNLGGGAFGTSQTAVVGVAGVYDVAVADMDGDGAMDILTASETSGRVSWWRNRDNLGDFSTTQVTITATAAGVRSIALADMDLDGDLDVLAAARTINRVTWHENMGGGATWMEHVVSGTVSDPRKVAVADVDGDGDPDVLVAAFNDDTLYWFENLVPHPPRVTGPSETDDTTPTWSWTSGGALGVYRYQLDSWLGTWIVTTATSYTPATPLELGPHTLYVQERIDQTTWTGSAAHTIRLLPSLVKAPLVSGTTPTTSPRPTWGWISGGDGTGTFRYQLNSETADAWTVTKEKRYTPASDIAAGTHTLYVQEQDGEGNWSVSGSFAITVEGVDVNRPAVSGTTPTTSRRPTWWWTSGGGTGLYRYQLDATTGQWTQTTNTHYTPVTALTAGKHTLYVQERGQEEKWSASASFTIEILGSSLAAPAVDAVTPTTDRTPTWMWVGSAGGAGAFRYQLDGEGSGWTETTATSYTPASPLSIGEHTFYVQESDANGNWSPSGSFAVVIQSKGTDDQPPSVVIDQPGSAAVAANESLEVKGRAWDDLELATVRYVLSGATTGEGGASTQCNASGDAFAAANCEWSFSFIPLEGDTTLTVIATDTSGNEGKAVLALTATAGGGGGLTGAAALGLNSEEAYTAGDAHELWVQVRGAGEADVYCALILPGGGFHCLGGDMRLQAANRLIPLSRHWAVGSLPATRLVSTTLPDLAPGEYAWVLLLVPAGSDAADSANWKVATSVAWRFRSQALPRVPPY